ncbi:MAG: prepilin-type N-terminal cleavage/methylation domain-containing protein [Bryobacterales bacterium]|nr:prepilin-type N-terminal cleavage/methylation domain-containing protein [Bryobacterales bacterium]
MMFGGSGVRKRRNRGFSLIELLIVIAIILIISAIAIPRITSTKRMANEVAAIRACQAINTAQIQYFAQFGRYASTLNELGPPTAGAQPTPDAAALMDENLVDGIHLGYAFSMIGTPAGYSLNADPQSPDSGTRTFYTDHSTTVRHRYGGEPAGETDPPIE